MKVLRLPQEERPRERLLKNGAESLSVIELLAILLRTGTNGQDVLEYSASLLDKWGGLEGLCRARAAELMQERGLKQAKVAVLLAVMEIGRRIAVIDSTHDRDSWKAKIEAIALETKFVDAERIYALFLDAKERVLDQDILSYGGLSGAYLDIPVFYRKAVRLNAYSVVLVHNHPDGALCASREDVILTNKIQEGLGLLGIELKGHYIAAKGSLVRV